MQVSKTDIISIFRKNFLFSKISKESLELIAENSEILFFEKNDRIYFQNANAKNVYLVLDGEVAIQIERKNQFLCINTAKINDYFGEDALVDLQQRRSGAVAIKDSLILKIPSSIIYETSNENPEVSTILDFALATYEKTLHLNINELPEERIFLITQQSPLTFFTKTLPILFFGIIGFLVSFSFKNEITVLSNWAMYVTGLLLLISFLYVYWQFVEWKNDLLIFTGKRIVNIGKKIGIFDRKFEILLASITGTEIKTNLAGRMLGLGILLIRTLTSETSVSNIEKIELVKDFLESLIARDRENKNQNRKEEFAAILNLEKVNIDSNSTNLNEDENIEVANTFQARDWIVYRSHWLVLIKKIVTPLLLFIGSILLIIFLNLNGVIDITQTNSGLVSFTYLILLALVGYYQFLDWKNDQFLITPTQVIDLDRKPFSTEKKRTANLANIQSVRFERKGFFGLIFNFGTIYIRVGEEELTFDNVPRPSYIQGQIFLALERFNETQRIIKQSEEQHQFVEWMDIYHQIISTKKENSSIKEDNLGRKR